MKLPFRQGIVKGNVNPPFLQLSRTTDFIGVYAVESSTIITFAHYEYDYLYEESKTIADAWGPFPQDPAANLTYYLYWDIDISTGLRTFGYTNIAPIVSDTEPYPPANGLHWFNTTENIMKVSTGYGWIDKIRVFAGSYNKGKIVVYPFGSQVGIDGVESYSGFILFDDNDLPLKRSNTGRFLTTESQFYTTKSIIGTVSFDSVMFFTKAKEYIPAFRVVSFYGDDCIALAKHDDPDKKAAVGMVRSDVYKDDTTNIVTNGYVSSISWDWRVPPATALYLGMHGTLQINPPTYGFIQKIGTVVSRDTIFLNIDPQIIYNTADHVDLSIPVSVDIVSGKLFTAYNPIEQIPVPPDTNPTIIYDNNGVPIEVNTPVPDPTKLMAGYTFVLHNTPKQIWVLEHNLNTTNVFVQTYDEDGNFIIPDNILIVDANTVKVKFNTPTLGSAQIVLFISPAIILIRDLNVPQWTHKQEIASDVWICDHSIGYQPITRVYIVDPATDAYGPFSLINVHPLTIEHDADGMRTIVTFSEKMIGLVRFA